MSVRIERAVVLVDETDGQTLTAQRSRTNTIEGVPAFEVCRANGDVIVFADAQDLRDFAAGLLALADSEEADDA